MYDLSGGSYLFIIKTSNKLDLTICLTLQFKKKEGKKENIKYDLIKYHLTLGNNITGIY